MLGSLPSRRSLQAGEYYAHHRNAFWPIIAELTGSVGPYARCCETLIAHRIALWDVLAHSVRPGSLDSAIQLESAQANDFGRFFREHPAIERICFNGKTAAQLFRKLVQPAVDTAGRQILVLPSTSPAHAAMSYEDKLEHWRSALDL